MPILEPTVEHEIDPALQQKLLDYPGKWVAITRHELIAIGDSPSEVARESERMGVEDFILHHVPEDHETIYFL